MCSALRTNRRVSVEAGDLNRRLERGAAGQEVDDVLRVAGGHGDNCGVDWHGLAFARCTPLPQAQQTLSTT